MSGRATVNGVAALLVILSGCRTGLPLANSPVIRFRDVSDSAGIRFERFNGAFGRKWMPETMGGGGAFLDYDNDGNLDVLLINGDWWPGHPVGNKRPTMALYRNMGNDRFRDVTAQTALTITMQVMGVAVGD